MLGNHTFDAEESIQSLLITVGKIRVFGYRVLSRMLMKLSSPIICLKSIHPYHMVVNQTFRNEIVIPINLVNFW